MSESKLFNDQLNRTEQLTPVDMSGLPQSDAYPEETRVVNFGDNFGGSTFSETELGVTNPDELPIVAEVSEQADAVVTGNEQTVIENPYARFQPEQLEAIKANVVDSVVRGVKAYDTEAVDSSARNLFAIERDLERRRTGAETISPRERTKPEGDINITKPNSEVVATMIDALKDVDGAATVSYAIKDTLEFSRPRGDQLSDEDYLRNVEVQALMHEVAIGLKVIQGEIAKKPYCTKTNVELLQIAARFEATIGELEGKGKTDDAAGMRDKLKQLRAVQEFRKAARIGTTETVDKNKEEIPMSQADFEAGVREQVTAIHENARVEGRELTPGDIEAIKNMAQSVRERRLASR